MTISRIQSESSKIQKNYYETISKISLDEFSLFDEEHLLYCSSSNNLFDIEDKRINKNILKKTPYVSWDHSDKFPEWEPPYEFNINTSSPFIEGVAYLILSGKYIGYLPKHYAEAWVKKNILRPIKPKITSRKISRTIIRRKRYRTFMILRIHYFIKVLNLFTFCNK